MTEDTTTYGVARRPVDHQTSVRANRIWWDVEAQDYYQEHGTFLGDEELVWGPEGWTEDQLKVLGAVRGRRVLEVGAGAAQGSRYLCQQGAEVVATDLSAGMLGEARLIDARSGAAALPLAQCDGSLLPFPPECFDIVFSAYGVLPFVADVSAVFAEVARVLRPGGQCAFATTHPIRWAFPDSPGREGLTVHSSYFDRTPYVEEDDAGRVTYVEHHRTMGDWVREIAAVGLQLRDVLEPEWPPHNDQVWGGWSRLRGEHIPGTAILVATKPLA